MIVLDWRGAARDTVAAVFERERGRWLETLQWDPARALREVEHARTTWGLPGLIALDEQGNPLGSIFYLPDSKRFDIGGVTADTPAVTAALLDTVVARARAESIGEVRCFVFDSAPNLGNELHARGFSVEKFEYLTATLGPSGVQGGGRKPDGGARLETNAWRAADLAGTAMLLQDAYDRESARVFAPQGTREEWERYLRNLIEHGACGDLNVQASRVLRSAGQVLAAAVVTVVAPRTAHLAQFAVHPAVQRQGVARAVLEEVWQTTARQGFERATLLVAEGNTRARALYASLGFHPAAAFLAAHRVLPAVA